MSKIRKYQRVLVAVLIIAIGIYAYFFFASQPHLVGKSPSNIWEAEYTRTGEYWDGSLKRLKQDKITLQQFVIIENGKKVDYSPNKDESSHSSFDFKALGDRPSKKDTYKVQIQWKNDKGVHKEIFSLNRSYNPF